KLSGSVSGGCVESDVFVAAQEVMDSGVPRLVTYGINDDMAFGVGLPCGGEIDVFVEPAGSAFELDPAERAVVFTVVAGEPFGAKLLVREDGSTAGDGPPELAALAVEALRRGRGHVLTHEGRTVFADVHGPPPTLFVYGAVDTAEALCGMAKQLGWRTVVADARARFLTRERIPSADELLPLWPEEALEQLRPDTATAILVLTHDDKFDLPLLTAAVKTDAFYIGALGSRRNQERRRELLREAGLTDEELERISGPSGLDIGADTPAETALSMLAEALAVRANRRGGLLRDSPYRIHAPV
ncbi:MAG TPA: XdhC family protein, partial [Gaiellaceae bacterium]|nr:XdhC family protein [Gaiellaceae bacterium]